jgi:hypothetical protein
MLERKEKKHKIMIYVIGMIFYINHNDDTDEIKNEINSKIKKI